MSNLVLVIKNGEFVDSNGKFQTKFQKNFVEGNGWSVHIKKNGTIKAEAKRKYSDGEYIMHYTVYNRGFAKLTLKTPKSDTEKVVKRGFVTPKGERTDNGTLTLSGGRIDERFAYFRCESFINMLKKYNLKGIKHQNPNRIYEMRELEINGIENSDTIFTDGKTKPLSRKDFKINRRGDEKRICKVKVEDATWVILTSNGERFLYSENNNLDEIFN